ncbi:MAG: hypothetical protein ONB48_16405 [candidate division KSB1 bacterium]|nr:hypothetical protein [candidate division KSB1 bacterium]MDZ7274246.1 hypothetical protein [candidate division KSB1 bacterium]MDZ7287232.1 hypothetical protein [candidate division KSB1 bacterium]MDZ7296844.1 hypothetical protein [candidate division KSB1 bacterium]MDZ7306052.1 hypothetical protein [candidate division KSB1 bacterium]
MNKENVLTFTWIKLGAIAGVIACVVYAIMAAVDMPRILTVAFAAAFGPLLSLASVGLYHLLKLHQKSVSTQIAAGANVIAGSIVNMMLIVQLAISISMRDYVDKAADAATKSTLELIWKAVDKVQLGLDVSWDVFIGIGTLLFAVNMLKHPRFGKILGGIGALLAVLLLGFNLYTFPIPPANADLIDFGPFVGLWYLIISIQMLRSLTWAKNALENQA